MSHYGDQMLADIERDKLRELYFKKIKFYGDLQKESENLNEVAGASWYELVMNDYKKLLKGLQE